MKIGDIVYVKPINDRARCFKDDILNHIETDTVEKVGKKYFYLKNYPRYKFEFDTMCNVSNCSSSWRVYLSMQEMYDEKEFNKLKQEIRNVFGSYGKLSLPLDQLRKIKAIIDAK